MKKPWARGHSVKPGESENQKDGAHQSIDRPENPDPLPPGRREKSDRANDELVPDSADGKLPDDSEPRQIIDSLWWQLGQGARSLAISALAAIVLIAANLVEPGHMKTWLVFASIPLYFTGVVLSFRIERTEHRKRRAYVPLDVSGGGRFALITAAIILCSADGPATDGLSARLAMAALLLGSAADGTWIAIVATRQRIGFWRAWYELGRRQREARRRCWTALIGRDAG